KFGKGKPKATELETISKAVLTEVEQLKIITKRSCKEIHSSHVSGSGADEGTGVTPGVPDAPDYETQRMISPGNQDNEDDDEHDDNEKAQDDDDEELTESEDDGDDFIHPKLTT
ncbi:hypothetical protein Tco_0444341, partial [Tanacetum coccineum]